MSEKEDGSKDELQEPEEACLAGGCDEQVLANLLSQIGKAAAAQVGNTTRQFIVACSRRNNAATGESS